MATPVNDTFSNPCIAHTGGGAADAFVFLKCVIFTKAKVHVIACAGPCEVYA